MIGKMKTHVNIDYLRLILLAAVLISVAGCAGAPVVVPTSTAIPSATSVPSNTPTPFATFTLVPPLTPPTPTAAAAPAVLPPVAEWQAEYFSNDSWQGPAALTRVDPEPVFDWQAASPAPEIPVDAFTVRWTRCLDLEERYYIFTANADDYVHVYLDDITVLESPVIPGTEVPFAVTAGQHCIKVEYREFIGGAYVNFAFRPGETFPVADAATAWQAEYFSNKDLQGPAAYTRNDPAPQFDWQLGNAAPGLPTDNFSVRWTRCLDLEGRDYTFTAQADEYVRVLVDDAQVLEAPVSVNGVATIPISAGRHCIKVEYRDDQGPANVNVSFQ